MKDKHEITHTKNNRRTNAKMRMNKGTTVKKESDAIVYSVSRHSDSLQTITVKYDIVISIYLFITISRSRKLSEMLFPSALPTLGVPL